MPRRALHKCNLTEIFLQRVQPQSKRFLVWDTDAKGLALQVRPNGECAWKFVYSFQGRVRWFHIGDASAWGLSNARKRARELKVEVDRENDPQAAKRARRSTGTFKELAQRYLEEYAMKHNKSWKQANSLVGKHLLPTLGKLKSIRITHDDAERTVGAIKAPVVANQTMVAGSAIFSWAIKKRIDGLSVNPFSHIERNKVQSRERVLSESELSRFWTEFHKGGLVGKALKLILLTGQRPGEVVRLRREHIRDGWWELPGKPVPELGWPGTKNGQSHRVWLSRPVQELIGDPHGEGFVLEASKGQALNGNRLANVMKRICGELGIGDKVTPHDLRRTFSTTVTGLGFGRDAMNRVTNHKDGGIASVYDRHRYATENQRIMETVAGQLVAVVEGRSDVGKIVALRS
jgi:integrase